MLDALKAANAVLRFLLEIGILIAFGYWGYRIGSNKVVRIALAIGIPVVVAAVWILYGAPGATYQLKDPLHLGLEVLLFGGAAAALAAVHQRTAAVALAVLFVVNRGLMYAWNQ